MLFIAHRINTIQELKTIPTSVGVEVDIRNKGTQLVLAHDPYPLSPESKDAYIEEDFDAYLSHFKHAFIILNVKTEGIENQILSLLKKYNITQYFFLDCSFPMIYKLSHKLNEDKIAMRVSQFESIETVKNMIGKVKWLWIDCFSEFPLDPSSYQFLKNYFKLCYVSPELQQQPEKVFEMIDLVNETEMIPDMVCSKIANWGKWSKSSRCQGDHCPIQ